MSTQNVNDYPKRFETFKGWKGDVNLASKLALHGFIYTGTDDIVKCSFCNIEIGQWNKFSDPIQVHLKIQKQCPKFIYDMYKIDKNRFNSFIEWPKSNIDVKKLVDAGFFYTGISDQVECFNCKLKCFDWQPIDDPYIVHIKFNNTCDFISSKISTFNAIEDNKCIICYNRIPNVCFLECGHVICCIECSVKNITKCPKCQTDIVRMVKIYT